MTPRERLLLRVVGMLGPTLASLLIFFSLMARCDSGYHSTVLSFSNLLQFIHSNYYGRLFNTLLLYDAFERIAGLHFKFYLVKKLYFVLCFE
jgi:hypothetical protein